MTAVPDVDTAALGDRIHRIADEEDIPVLGVAASEEMESEPDGRVRQARVLRRGVVREGLG